MTTATHLPTKWLKAQGSLTSGQAINLSGDTFKMLMVKAGSGIPNTSSSGVQFVADVTATNPEDTSIGARPTLTGVTWAYGSDDDSVDWSFDNIVYAQNSSDDGLSRYGVIYDSSVGSGDSTYPVAAILDFGQTVTVVNGSLTLQSPTGGLIQYTGGG